MPEEPDKDIPSTPVDFFISYVRIDRKWAEWVAWVLEEQNYRVTIQAWDQVPGTDWAAAIESSLESVPHVIAVISPDYWKSEYARLEARQPRWKDLRGERRRLIPVVVVEHEIPSVYGILSPIRLHGRTEQAAQEELLSGISAAVQGRIKPSTRPLFPGPWVAPIAPSFPGPSGAEPAEQSSSPVDEKVKGSPGGPRDTRLPQGTTASLDELPEEFGVAIDTFEGREAALAELVRWLADPDDRRSRLVRGGPGSGKTALLGLLAHLAHERYVDRVPELPPERVPPVGSIDVALHANGMVPGAVLGTLARAAGMPPDRVAAMLSVLSVEAGRHELMDFLERNDKRLTVLLDAVDEATDPKALARDLLSPLVSDPSSRVRFLLGGRPNVDPDVGFGPDNEDARVVSLDGGRYQDDAALGSRVSRILTDPAPDRPQPSPWAQAPRPLLNRIVAGIVDAAGTSFLVGETIATREAKRSNLPDPDDRAWRDGLPREAGGAMRADLEARLGADEAQRAMDILRPLAYGRGNGIPRPEVWFPLANALLPGSARPCTQEELDKLDRHTSSYVVRSPVPSTGRPSYRLYHRALAEYLRDGRDVAADERAITRTLLRRVGLRDGTRNWDSTPSYFRTHLIEHAVAGRDAAQLDELLEDPGFLANGSVAELRAALGHVTEPRHRASADAYNTAVTAMVARRSDDPRELMAQLSLAARCCGADRMAENVQLGAAADAAPWRTTWASWRPQQPALRLFGSGDRVRAIASATLADGRKVAVIATNDGTVRIWDVRTAEEVGTLIGAHEQAGNVRSLAVGRLPDGATIVVSGGDDKVARGWNLDTATQIGLHTHRERVRAVAVAELDRRTVAFSGGENNTVVGWDPVSGQEYWTLAGSRAPVASLAVVDIGADRRVVSADETGEVRVWELRPRGESRHLAYRGHVRAVRALAVGALDGAPLVASGDDRGDVHVWDPRTRVRRYEPLTGHPGGVRALAMAEVEGQPMIVSAGLDRTVRVWDLRTGEPVGAPFGGHTDWVRAVAVADVGNRVVVVSGGDDAMPMIWDLAPGGPAGEPFAGHTDRIRSLLVTQVDGQDRLVSGSSDATLRHWDPSTGASVGRSHRGHAGWVGALAAVDVGGVRRIASAGGDTTVRFWDAASGEPVAGSEPREHPAAVTALLSVLVDGVPKIVSATLTGQVQVWDPETGEEQASYPGHGKKAVRALCTVRIDSEPDPLVVSAGDDGNLHIWRPATGEEVRTVESGHARVTALAVARPDPGASGGGVATVDSWVASGGDDGVVRFRDLAGFRPHREWGERRSPVRALAMLSSEGTTVVASGHADGTVRFAHTATDSPVASFRWHRGRVGALALGTARGRPALFSAGDDGLIRIWDQELRAPLPEPHRGPVRAVAVTSGPDGDWLVLSGGDDDDIQIRALSDGRPRRAGPLRAYHRGVRALAVSDDTDPPVVVSGGVGTDHLLRLWNLTTQRPLGSMPGHRDWVHALATSTRRGQPVVVSASGDETIGVWDLRTRAVIGGLHSDHRGRVRALAVADLDNGRRVVVSGSADGTVLASQLDSHEPVGERFTGHRPGRVRALTATRLAGTDVVVSGDDTGAVLVWELLTGTVLGGVPHGSAEVNAVAAAQQGFGTEAWTWVAVAAGDTVTLSSWASERGWAQTCTARLGVPVHAVAMVGEHVESRRPGRLVVGASHGVVVLEVDAPSAGA